MIYALSDLHLSTGKNPMDIYPGWHNHSARIFKKWKRSVTNDDLVLIPGDISWATTFDAALPDLRKISKLPGDKIILKGNHDWWWSWRDTERIKQINTIRPLQSTPIVWDGWSICGVTGSPCPGVAGFDDRDMANYKEQAAALENSIRKAKTDKIIVMLHYPPWNSVQDESLYSRLLCDHGVKACIYGHLHGGDHKYSFNGLKGGVYYRLVSADYLRFKPVGIINKDVILPKAKPFIL